MHIANLQNLSETQMKRDDGDGAHRRAETHGLTLPFEGLF